MLLSSGSTGRFSLKKYKADGKREYGLQKLKTQDINKLEFNFHK